MTQPVETITGPVGCEACGRTVAKAIRANDGHRWLVACGRCYVPLQATTRRGDGGPKPPNHTGHPGRCDVCGRHRRGALRRWEDGSDASGLVCWHPPCVEAISGPGVRFSAAGDLCKRAPIG